MGVAVCGTWFAAAAGAKAGRQALVDEAQSLAAALDLLLTQAFFAYATHLVEGQIDPALVSVDWRARRRKVDLVRLLPPA